MRYKPVALVGAAENVTGSAIGLPVSHIKTELATPIYIAASDIPLTGGGYIEPSIDSRQMRAIPVHIRGAVAPFGSSAMPSSSLLKHERAEPWYIVGTNGVLIGSGGPSENWPIDGERATPIYIAGVSSSVVAGADLLPHQIEEMEPIEIFITDSVLKNGFQYAYSEANAATFGEFEATYRSIARRNKLNGVTYSVSTFGDLAAVPTARYFGAAYAPAVNAVYCVPMRAAQVLRIDCSDDSLSFVGSDYGTANTAKWEGAYLAEDGKIYCPPRNSDDILVIDPATDTTTIIPTGQTGSNKWGSVLGDNQGYLYFSPRDHATFMQLRLSDYQVTQMPGVTNTSPYLAKGGGCMGPDGRLYFAGFDHTGLPSYYVDPTTRTLASWGVYGNQRAGVFPWGSSLRSLVFNVTTSWLQGTGTYTPSSGAFAYQAYNAPLSFFTVFGSSSSYIYDRPGESWGCLADGAAYSVAGDELNWISRIGLESLDHYRTGHGLTTSVLQWLGTAAANGGRYLYVAPYNNAAVLKITLNNAIPVPDAVMASPLYQGGGK